MREKEIGEIFLLGKKMGSKFSHVKTLSLAKDYVMFT